MEKKQTVIYIVSDRRSGSTLLENILSKSSEIVSVGELAMLHGHILKEGPGERWNWTCSCGTPVAECSFWAPVLADTWNKNKENFNTNISWNYRSGKLKATGIVPVIFKNRLLEIINSKKNKNVPTTLDALYTSIFKHTGKSFIVDSSKDPLQALSLYRTQHAFDVKIIWLTRDIRAVAVSKSKWKELNIKKQKSIKKLLFDVLFYKRICSAAMSFVAEKDKLHLTYEDVAQHTQDELDKIVEKFGLDRYAAPEYMYVENDHTIGGTPNRFTKRPIVFEEGWKKNFQNKKLLNLLGSTLNKL